METLKFNKMQKKVKAKLPTLLEVEKWHEDNWDSYGSWCDCKKMYEWLKTKMT